jgi:hypothetical protein
VRDFEVQRLLEQRRRQAGPICRTVTLAPELQTKA